MNIKLKAALDTLAMVTSGLIVALGFGTWPKVTATVITVGLVVMLYKLNLDDLKFKEKYKIGEDK